MSRRPDPMAKAAIVSGPADGTRVRYLNRLAEPSLLMVSIAESTWLMFS